MEINEQLRNKLVQFQNLQQQAQIIAVQKANLTAVEKEYDAALEELKTGKEVYKAVGPLMVKSTPAALSKDLNLKKEENQSRIELLEKQEKKLTTKLQAMGNELQTELGGSKDVEAG